MWTFTRAAQDWEVLRDLTLCGGYFPKIISVHSFYKILTQSLNNHFPWKKIWKTKAPPRVAFFVWTTSLRKISTMESLRKCGVIIVDWCCCVKKWLTVDHFLFYCEVASMLWEDIHTSRVGVGYAYNDGWAFGMLGKLGGILLISAMWKMIPICILWCIWQERNDRMLTDKERSLEDITSLEHYFYGTKL